MYLFPMPTERYGSTGRIGFFYVNGMLADDANASKDTETIQHIIEKAPGFQAGQSFVTLHRNNATTTDRLIKDLVLGIFGTACITYALTKKKKNEVTAAVLSIGVLALGYAIYDYKKMQDDKNKIASDLAGQVTKFLVRDRSRIANIFAHSQGADVLYRTLWILKGTRFVRQIKVITFGAMTTIPRGMCAKVMNFKFTNDMISRVVAYPFEMIRCTEDKRKRKVIDLECEGINTHGVGEYLKDPSVRKAIQSLIRV